MRAWHVRCSSLSPNMHKNMMMTMVGFGALLLSSTAMAQEPDASAAPPAASPATEADKPSKTVKASSETERNRWVRVLSYFILLTKKRKGVLPEADQ